MPWPFQTNVTFAAVLSVFTSISMQALFQVALLMEDHFDSVGLDDIGEYMRPPGRRGRGLTAQKISSCLRGATPPSVASTVSWATC